MRVLLKVLSGVAAVLVVVAVVVSLVLFRSIPPLDGKESLPALSAPVEVLWDSLGIPHLAAASDADALKALGYLHARDRLWQMETLRRTAEGRLAEVLGPAALGLDRFLRSLDIPRAAAASLGTIAPEARALAEAYVAGVNQWISHHPRPLPPEFQLLRFAPEPWTMQQVVEVARVMSWDLVSARLELNLARAAARLGPERARDLVPLYPDSAPVILAPGTATWRNSGRANAPALQRAARNIEDRWLPSALLAESDIPGIPPLAAEVLDAVAMTRASNSWVIGSSRSRSGKPILANDPHLRLSAPSLWYLAVIESPRLHVAGATIPGLPAVIIGHNRRIAWGLTNGSVDDVDYVIERLSADSSRVLTPDGWAPVEVVRDSIRVRGRQAVPFTVRRTAHGPIVDEAAPDSGWTRAPSDSAAPVTVLAMRWNGQDPSDELTALIGVDRAGSWTDFLAAVSGFKSPEQNWIYADVDGNIGYTASGAVPVRRSGVGLLPTPGWTDEGRWERYLDFDELPRAFNPPDGFIVTANNRVIGPEYPHFLAQDWDLGYRAARIREMLVPGGPFTALDVGRMQMDTVDVFARWARRLAADAAATTGRQDLAERLRAWDGTMGSDRTEPTLFYVWYRDLQRLTYEDELGGYAPSGPLHRWLRAGGSPWFDDIRTPERENLAALSARAMREALPVAEGVKWGDAHVTVSQHALGGVGPLNRLLGLNLGPAPRAGSLYTVDVADFGSFAPPFVNTHAASFRQVVDLADIEAGRMIATAGQSGNPLARRYRDQSPRWWRGELWEVPLDRERVAAVGTLHLTPLSLSALSALSVYGVTPSAARSTSCVSTSRR